jgi:hypothetical protein
MLKSTKTANTRSAENSAAGTAVSSSITLSGSRSHCQTCSATPGRVFAPTSDRFPPPMIQSWMVYSPVVTRIPPKSTSIPSTT